MGDLVTEQFEKDWIILSLLKNFCKTTLVWIPPFAAKPFTSSRFPWKRIRSFQRDVVPVKWVVITLQILRIPLGFSNQIFIITFEFQDPMISLSKSA